MMNYVLKRQINEQEGIDEVQLRWTISTLYCILKVLRVNKRKQGAIVQEKKIFNRKMLKLMSKVLFSRFEFAPLENSKT